MNKPGKPAAETSPVPEHIRQLAWLLDESIPLPFGRRVGFDALIGLIPVIGDLFGALASGTIMMEARKSGASNAVLMRMGGNLIIDTLLGAIPLVGDLFDFGFKSNSRNMRLLMDWYENPPQTARRSRLLGIALIGGLMTAVIAAFTVSLLLAQTIWRALGL